ncbi:hypothetical protein Mpt1_c13000 [Candidatus Methanoplasma termitum]|uniref:DUF2975 domain-containing protein n=1 Tax=Candidatus Methanoplasma termitum TaxID=1577791 RepID=A0A0A7LFX1_9ARCH|nr:hypothetical protein [Candidatus Methanoplasma termitum]AIZ57162.1 hypothetical protein Mpt1_c13000 [Candidatus Methanoplasma termitum]
MIYKGRWKVALLLAVLWVSMVLLIVEFVNYENMYSHGPPFWDITDVFWMCLKMYSISCVGGIAIYVGVLQTHLLMPKDEESRDRLRRTSSQRGLFIVTVSFLSVLIIYLSVEIYAIGDWLAIILLIGVLLLFIIGTYALLNVIEMLINYVQKSKLKEKF